MIDLRFIFQLMQFLEFTHVNFLTLYKHFFAYMWWFFGVYWKLLHNWNLLTNAKTSKASWWLFAFNFNYKCVMFHECYTNCLLLLVIVNIAILSMYVTIWRKLSKNHTVSEYFSQLANIKCPEGLARRVSLLSCPYFVVYLSRFFSLKKKR